MRVFFLSDLHLSHGEAPQAVRFAAWLRSVPQRGDILLLGGDLFDLFVGNKEIFRERFREVISAIVALGRAGVRVYYLEGNHDFLLGALFEAVPGITIQEEDLWVDVGGRKILVSHGDQIDPTDRGYRLLRWFTRHPFFRAFLRLLPGAFVDKVGRGSSRQSRKYNNQERMTLENQARLRGLYLEFARKSVEAGADHVLVGHSHLRDHQPVFAPGGRRGEYVNLGFSEDNLPFAVLEPSAAAFSIQAFV